jgi:hypothetical protein
MKRSMVSRDMMIGSALLAGFFLGRGSTICNICVIVFVLFIFMREQSAPQPCLECGDVKYVPFIERKREEKETEPLKEAEECARIQTPTGGIEGYLAATALTQTPAEIANRVDVTTAPSTLAQNRTEFYNSLVGAEALQEPQNPGLYTLEALS